MTLRQEAYVDDKFNLVPDHKVVSSAHRLMTLHRMCLSCGSKHGFYKGRIETKSGKFVSLD